MEFLKKILKDLEKLSLHCTVNKPKKNCISSNSKIENNVINNN